MNKAKTVLVFLVCGLLAGFGFGALLRSPRLLTFWFIKGDKFLIPTYRYYFGVGVFLLLGLGLAFSICRVSGLIRRPPGNAVLRGTFSAIIVATSALLVFVIASRMSIDDPAIHYLLSIVAFVLLISLACWIITARLYYVGVFLNLLTLPFCFVVLSVAGKTVGIPGEWYELISYPFLFSSLTAACGFWIAAGTRANE